MIHPVNAFTWAVVFKHFLVLNDSHNTTQKTDKTFSKCSNPSVRPFGFQTKSSKKLTKYCIFNCFSCIKMFGNERNSLFLTCFWLCTNFPSINSSIQAFFLTKTKNSKVNRRILCEMKMKNDKKTNFWRIDTAVSYIILPVKKSFYA